MHFDNNNLYERDTSVMSKGKNLKNGKTMFRYDLIFSLGSACSCTQILRKAQLQFASYPLDWLFGSDLVGRADIVISRFERFLEIDDLSYAYSERSIACDAYHNAYNKLTFNHDFEAGKEVKETYPAVKEKYDRRIKRLLDRIDGAQAILGVFIELPDAGKSKYTPEDLRRIHVELNKAFPNKRFDLLYVSPDTALKHGEIVTEWSEEGINHIVSEYRCRKADEPSYVPDFHVLRNILHDYRLKQPFLFCLKRKLQYLGIKLCPIPFLRKKMKRKYRF